MKTRSHTREIELQASPEKVFALLITPSAIRQWWSAARAIVLPQPGGIWAATWGDDEDSPDYITAATIEVFDPLRRLVLSDYRSFARTGPLPFDADFTTEFVIEPSETGSRLAVTQSGFPAGPIADDFYADCEQGWHDTFEAIRKFVEGPRLSA